MVQCIGISLQHLPSLWFPMDLSHFQTWYLYKVFLFEGTVSSLNLEDVYDSFRSANIIQRYAFLLQNMSLFVIMLSYHLQLKLNALV